MKKLTKLLSIFVIAGVVGTGVAGVAACNTDEDTHTTHNYSYTDNKDGKTHTATCDGCDSTITDQLHVDGDDNDVCDNCGGAITSGSSVEQGAVTEVKISGVKQVAVKGTLQLTATVTVTGNAAKTVTWSSSDETKATVDANGLVTGVAECEEVTITATSTYDTAKKGELKIKVVAEGTVIDETPDYDVLCARDNKLYNSDFSEAGTVGVHNGYGTKGIYTDIADAATIADGVLKHQADVKGSDGKGSNSSIIVDFGPIASDSTLEGYLEFTCSAMGSKWNLVRFYNGTSAVFTLRVPTSWTANDGGNFVYSLDNGTTEVATEEAVAAAKDTLYKLYYKFDLATGKVTVNLSGKKIVTDLEANIKGITGINISSSSSGSRLVTVDNLVYCGTAMTVSEYKTNTLANLDKEYAKYTFEDKEGEEGATIPATHKINAALVTKAYNDGKTAIEAANEFGDVSSAYNTAVAAMKAVLSDVKVAEARTAALAALDEKLPADNYKYDYAADSADEIYNNKSTYDTEIAEIKSNINAATTQEALDKIVADATISVGDNAVQLAAKKTAAKADLAGYKTADIAALETDHATQYDNIKNAETGIIVVATGNIESAADIDGVNAVLTKAKKDIDNEIKATQESWADTVKRYQDDLDAVGAAELQGVEDQDKKDAVNDAVTAGKAAIAALPEKAANIGAVYTAEENKIRAAIPKIEKIDELEDYVLNSIDEIQGESEAAQTAEDAIYEAGETGEAAISAAASVDAVNKAFEAAQKAIDGALNTLKNTEFDVFVFLGDNDVGKNIKVKYGSTLTITESDLDLADNQMLDKIYDEDENELDPSTVYYDEVMVSITVKTAKTLSNTNSYSYDAISGLTADSTVIAQSDFNETQNSFITVLNDGNNAFVKWRDGKEKNPKCIEIFGDAMQVTVLGSGTLTLTLSSTGSGNWSSIAVKDATGNYIPATYTASENIMADGNVYGVKTSATQSTLKFNLSEGTYTICTLAAVGSEKTGRNTRVYGVALQDTYKAACDVTVTWGDQEVKYHHSEEITAPVPTGLAATQNFDYWYYMDGETEVKWTNGSTLKAGNYTYIAKISTVVPVDSVEVSASAQTVEIGGKVTLTVTAKDADENELTGRTVVWSITDGEGNTYANAEIKDGVLTIKNGATVGDTITVTATIGSKSNSVTITVTAPTAVSGSLDVGTTISSNTETNVDKNGVIKITANTNMTTKELGATGTSNNPVVVYDGTTYDKLLVAGGNPKTVTIKSTKAATLTLLLSSAKDANARNSVADTITIKKGDTTVETISITASEWVKANGNSLDVHTVTIELAANDTITIDFTSGRLVIVNLDYSYMP